MKWKAYKRTYQPDNPQAAVKIRVTFHVTFEEIVEHLVGMMVAFDQSIAALPKSKKGIEEEIRSQLASSGDFDGMDERWQQNEDKASEFLPSVIEHVKKIYPELQNIKYSGDIEFPEEESEG